MDISSQQPLHHRHSHFFRGGTCLGNIWTSLRVGKKSQDQVEQGNFIPKQHLSFFFQLDQIKIPHQHNTPLLLDFFFQQPPSKVIKISGLPSPWA